MRLKYHFKSFTLCIFCVYILQSCKQELQGEDENVAFRTLIFYIVADNDLSNDAQICLQEIRNGYVETGANVIVFIDSKEGTPTLLKIGKNCDDTILKSYEEFNSTSPIQINTILRDVAKLYPAKSYGLIFWSHGTSWLPAGLKLKSFGNDEGLQINITDLADAIPFYFDFIIFDACLMGSIEVAYEFKDKTNYIIASSTEILSSGFPYQLILPELLKEKCNLKKVCETYFDLYNSFSGEYQSATISLINTSQIYSLAIAFKSIVENSIYDAKKVDRLSIQRLDCFNEQYCFDLLDYVEKAFPDISSEQFTKALENTVIYKNHTTHFINFFNINNYSGLSSYVYNPQRIDLDQSYKDLKWYKSSGLSY